MSSEQRFVCRDHRNAAHECLGDQCSGRLDSSEQLDGILLGEQVGYERRSPWAQTRAPVTGPGAQGKRLQGGALDLADLDALGAAAEAGPDPGAALASAGLGRGSSHRG